MTQIVNLASNLTTPNASSMNVSGLNLDVGNPKAPTSSTWSIPNISDTPIPPKPTKTQLHVSWCQKAHLKSHQTLIPIQNFHVSSSLVPVGIQAHPRIPLEEVKSQTSIFHQDLRLMCAMKGAWMGGDKKDHWRM
ncbi:hypothetical protein O181_126875 [Austropuccinia psidii MF-1]|uniref:Uncharacterized protein n=1 Tax=Austropuccinia psidii MF-1 TaxID=1389203 RepID=A0A9Q3KS52_9BASI|nr:hypothetical protein [Austropuccinia psidii MF-1]